MRYWIEISRETRPANSLQAAIIAYVRTWNRVIADQDELERAKRQIILTLRDISVANKRLHKSKNALFLHINHHQKTA